MRILAAEKVAEEGLALLREHHQVEEAAGLSQEELLDRVGDCEALLVRSGTKVTSEVIERGAKLRVIARAGVGIDNIDVAAATRRGIVVVNTPAASTVAAAEHTIGLILAMLRNIPQADRSMKAGKWERKALVGRELRSKTVGVVGLGRIGSEVARLLLAMNARVLAHDPMVRPEIGLRRGVEMVDVETILKTCDVVTMHAPLTDQTRHLIRKETIALMRDGAYLVNCARGGIVCTADLVEALQSGKLAGAALDVYEQEPPTEGELVGLPNVIATPHIAASTEEAQRNIGVLLAEQVLCALEGGLVSGAVNLPSVPADLLEQTASFVELLDALGRMMATLVKAPIERIEIGFSREVPADAQSYLVRQAVAWVLTPFLEGEAVNAVNALECAEERGIAVKDSHVGSWKGYPSVITLSVACADGEHSVTGAATEATGMRLLAMDDFVLDLRPVGNMLLTMHADKPGVVACVTTELAGRGINISEMHLARHEAGGRAMMLVGVDCALEAEVIEAIAGMKWIDTALCVTFPGGA